MNSIAIEGGLAGWYKIEAGKRDASGKEISRRVVADWFPNLITNQGLDRMGNNNDYLTWCQVGSGDNAPANGDTSLETFVAATSDTQSDLQATSGGTPYYVARTIVKRFGEGVAAGNLSEVGMAWGSGAGVLFSRALILDGLGSPTTITILSDEFLDVTYQLRIYPPEADVTGTISISGIDYDYTLRACLVESIKGSLSPEAAGWMAPTVLAGITSGNATLTYTGGIGPVTGEPSSAIVGTPSPSSVSNSAYGSSNLYRDCSTVWSLNNGNGNIRSIRLNLNWATYQIEFDPVIPKTNIKILTLNWRQTWARRTI